MKTLLCLMLLCAVVATAQISSPPSILFSSTSPSGACAASYNVQNITTGVQSACVGGTWAAISGGGGGAAVSYSIVAGNPNVLGTTCPGPAATLSIAQDSTAVPSSSGVYICVAPNLWAQVSASFGTGPYTLSGVSGSPTLDVAANRPACTTDALYFSVDTKVLSQCSSTNPGTWVQLNPSGYVAVIFNTTLGTTQTYDSSGNVWSLDGSSLQQAGVGGVTLDKLAAKDTSNPTKYVVPAASGCGSGVATATVAANGYFWLRSVAGQIYPMVVQGSVTAGHLSTGSTSSPGSVTDTGQTSRASVPSSTCLVGSFLSSGVDGSTVSIKYDGAGSYGNQTDVSSPIGTLPVSNTSIISIAQKFGGTSAPGSVAGNLPGDLYTDTTNHHEYICNAPFGTAAPACTSVTATGWLQVDGASGGGQYQTMIGSGSMGSGSDNTPRTQRAAMQARDNLSFDDDGTNTILDYNPVDARTVKMEDEFFGGLFVTSVGAYSTLGWRLYNLNSSASTVNQVTSGDTWPNLGVIRITTGATASMGFNFSTNNNVGAVGQLGALGSNTNWALMWIFRVNSTGAGTVRLEIGAGTLAATTYNPANWMGLRYDTHTGIADTNFQFFVNNSTGTTVPVDSGIAADTNFHTFVMYSTSSGTIRMYLDGGSEVTFCSSGCTATVTVPTTQMDPIASFETDTTAAKTLDIDKFAFRARVSSSTTNKRN